MLKTFFAFVRKETYHILRDRRTLFILFGMPVAQVLIFGYAVTNEFKDARIAVLDQAHDELSHQLVQRLQASGHFQLVASLPNQQAVDEQFRAGEIKLAVVIPAGFAADFYAGQPTRVQLLADGSDPNYATTLTSYAEQMIRQFRQAYSPAVSSSAGLAPFQVTVHSRMVYNAQLVSAYNFIPGVVAMILMLISAMLTSLTIAREKELGTMDLLLVSPLSPATIILGKVTPYVVLSFLNAIIILALGYWVFEVPIRGSLPILMGVCLLYLVVALSLGVFISTVAETQQTAMMVSLFSLMMPTMLLSGFLFPVLSMPVFLQYISAGIPATYFVELLRAIMLRGASGMPVAYPAMILAVMASVLLTMTWLNFKTVTR